ncbi:MAG: RNA polymerase sigma factor [Planctomycetota bacterium]
MQTGSRHDRHAVPTQAEEKLLSRLRAGDPAAFQTLVRPHLGALLALSRRLTGDAHWAEDLVQETLVRAFRSRAGFRGEASLRTWLFKIQLRLARDPSRWQHQEPAQPLTAVVVPDRLAVLPEDETLSRELRDRLLEAMERLSLRQRTALQIAEVLGGSRAAARMLVLAARRKVLARMGRYLEP